MKIECYLSEASVELINDAMEQMREWHFDAVNSITLISALMDCPDAQIKEYLINEDVEEDEIMDAVSMCFSAKVTELKLDKKGDKKEEDKKEEGKQTVTDKPGTTDKSGAKAKDKPEATDKSGTDAKTDGKKSSKAEEVMKELFNYKSEHDFDIGIMDSKKNKVMIPASSSMNKIVGKVRELCVKNKVEEIQPVHFSAALFETNDEALKDIFRDIGVSFFTAKKYFTSNVIFKMGVIPFALSGFLTNLNEKVNPKVPCEVLRRDKEVEQIWNISLKKNKRNTVIVGEAGVGKSALIEKITYDIVTGTCPERFKNFNVISLDVNSLIAGTSYRGDAEERIRDIIEFLMHNDHVILFIDEVHTILGAGSCFEGEMDLANALKPILARGDTIVIGATTNEEYYKYFAVDAALSRRFEKVEVEEPLSKDVYPMIRNKIKALSKFHGVKITKKMVEYTIMIASCFAFEKRNPDKTLDLLDRSMVVAHRKGLEYVDKDCVLANFGIYYKLWDGMNEDSRKEVAYHEAGHYIVGKASGRLTQMSFLAVSIMPAEFYLGVTVYEERKDTMPFANLDYYIDGIAFDLGGRVAENVFRNDYTSGAGQDLDNATRTAFHVVSKLGMTVDESKKRNNIFLNTDNYPMFTEKSTNQINDEVQALIEKAYDRAEIIITEHAKLLEMIVRELLEKQIMSETELDRIWRRYLRSKSRSKSKK